MIEEQTPLGPAHFEAIAREYEERCGFTVYLVSAEGQLLRGKPACKQADTGPCRSERRRAVRESLRWGDPSPVFCPAGRLMWGVPVMENERVAGGLIATAPQAAVRGPNALRLHQACQELRAVAEEHNVTNASALRISREASRQEQQRAYVLHAAKDAGGISVGRLYLREEPALVAALRAGDRQQARQILNQVLSLVHHHARGSLELLKGLYLELVVAMSRTAVEAGADPGSAFGGGYAQLAELSRIDREEELTRWLRACLERLLDVIGVEGGGSARYVVSAAVRYMESHCGQGVTRDETAQAAHVSPSHLSHLFRSETGTTFSDLLNRMRVDKAAELLARSRKPLSLVALECGFCDQSYFTRIFKRYRGITPGAYRKRRQTAGSGVPS